MKKICFITTSRADFGTLNELIKEVIKTKLLVQLIISGSHTDKFFGNTQKEINCKKKYLTKKVKVIGQNKNSKSVALSFADCVNKFTKALLKLKPNIFVIYGDRYEMLAAAVSSYILRIPIVHIAGGEKTFGSIDEGFRHSISKLANLHFPTTNKHRKRLIQLGENPKTIFNFGSLHFDKIKNNSYLIKKQLEKKLKIKFYKRNLVITYHPETISMLKSLGNLSILLKSLKKIKNTMMIITSPNADAQGNLMISYIEEFIKKNKLKNFLFFKSLGSQIYLSLLKIVDGVVGNSSSGISEVPFFNIGTVNIGDRQKDRAAVSSIINCKVSQRSIIKSINKIFKSNFRKKKFNELKIFGSGHTSKKITKKLLSFNFQKYNKKIFYDF